MIRLIAYQENTRFKFAQRKIHTSEEKSTHQYGDHSIHAQTVNIHKTTPKRKKKKHLVNPAVEQIIHGLRFTVNKDAEMVKAEGIAFLCRCVGLAVLVASFRFLMFIPGSVHLMCGLTGLEKLTKRERKKLEEELQNCVIEGLLEYWDVDKEQEIAIVELTK